jgi:hypothetical protein
MQSGRMPRRMPQLNKQPDLATTSQSYPPDMQSGNDMLKITIK